MHEEAPIAFAVEPPEPHGLEIRVNFGLFAGREATPAEIDELARALVPEVGDVEIVSEHRYEVGTSAEAEVHQVRISIGDPPAEDLAESLVELAARWARSCIAERSVDVPAT